VDAALKAIAEPRRRDILRLVWDAERSAGEIAAHFDVSRPAISQQLRVLKEAELIVERREGTRRWYRARPEGLEGLREYLDSFWEANLSELKHQAERQERRNARAATRNRRRHP
jgi:DNA-binding transcriptional ArsR family regulator